MALIQINAQAAAGELSSLPAMAGLIRDFERKVLLLAVHSSGCFRRRNAAKSGAGRIGSYELQQN
jgi:hypothetical protein